MDGKELKRRYEQGDRSFPKAQLQNADLTWLILSDADFTAANFYSANLSGATLKGVNLSKGANFSFANLSRVDLTRANLCGANLEGANLDGAILTDAVYDLHTQFPFRFDPSTSGAQLRELQPQQTEVLNPENQPDATISQDANDPLSSANVQRVAQPQRPLQKKAMVYPTALAWVALGAALSGILFGFGALNGADSKLVDPRSPTSVGETTAKDLFPTPNSELMTETEAIALIGQWHEAKAAAMGPQHNPTKLYQVLTLPALSQWQYSSDQVKQLGGHWTYTPHQVLVQTILPQDQSQIVLKAIIGESAQYYEQGKPIADQSSNGTYPMEFIVVRQNQRWLIQDLKIIR